jgi:hypothetical protein
LVRTTADHPAVEPGDFSMTDARKFRRSPQWIVRAALFAVALLFIAGCARHKGDDLQPMEQLDPVLVHVTNENYLDMNVMIATGGANRRLGMVSGNGVGDFSVPYSIGTGQGITLSAVPIGGRGSYTTPALSVSPGQVVEFKIGITLRQSTVTVHEP